MKRLLLLLMFMSLIILAFYFGLLRMSEAGGGQRAERPATGAGETLTA